MKEYTSTKPKFSDSIRVVETSDPAHADNINAAPEQLLQNTLCNREKIQELADGANAFQDDTTQKKYRMGIDNGLVYIQEVSE